MNYYQQSNNAATPVEQIVSLKRRNLQHLSELLGVFDIEWLRIFEIKHNSSELSP